MKEREGLRESAAFWHWCQISCTLCLVRLYVHAASVTLDHHPDCFVGLSLPRKMILSKEQQGFSAFHYDAHLPLVAMKITVEGEREGRSAALLKARGAPDIAPPSVCPSAKEAEEVGGDHP